MSESEQKSAEDHIDRLEQGFAKLHEGIGKTVDEALQGANFKASETKVLVGAMGQKVETLLDGFNARARRFLGQGSNFPPKTIEGKTEGASGQSDAGGQIDRGRAVDAEIVGDESKPAA